MLTLLTILLYVILIAAVYCGLEAVLGELAAAILCPIGWAIVTAAAEVVGLVGGEEE
jgi:hypothetical protein